jgi:hypothetical protein
MVNERGKLPDVRREELDEQLRRRRAVDEPE